VGAQRTEPALRASAHCAGNARLLAAPKRYLAAGSTAGSCLLESADDVSAEPERCRIEVQALVQRRLGCAKLCATDLRRRTPERRLDGSST